MDEDFGLWEPGFIGNFLIYLPNRHVIFSNETPGGGGNVPNRHLSPFALLSYEGGLPSRWPQGRGGGGIRNEQYLETMGGAEGKKETAPAGAGWGEAREVSHTATREAPKWWPPYVAPWGRGVHV